MTTREYVRLCPCLEPQVGDLLQQRTYEVPGVVTIDTSFYWPPEEEVAAGYTAPLSRWVETTIVGPTTTPIVLHGEYAQTYRPGHHNIGEEFIFDPSLEPGISQQQLDELAAAGIGTLHILANSVNTTCVHSIVDKGVVFK